MKKLHENKGEFSVKGAIILLVVAMLLVLSISVIGVINRVAILRSIADELVRDIEIAGLVDSNTYTELDRLTSASGLDCDVAIDADYISGTKEIQFGDAITVTVTHTASFGIGGIVSVPITLAAKSEGKSEYYWK